MSVIDRGWIYTYFLKSLKSDAFIFFKNRQNILVIFIYITGYKMFYDFKNTKYSVKKKNSIQLTFIQLIWCTLYKIIFFRITLLINVS